MRNPVDVGFLINEIASYGSAMVRASESLARARNLKVKGPDGEARKREVIKGLEVLEARVTGRFHGLTFKKNEIEARAPVTVTLHRGLTIVKNTEKSNVVNIADYMPSDWVQAFHCEQKIVDGGTVSLTVWMNKKTLDFEVIAIGADEKAVTVPLHGHSFATMIENIIAIVDK